ncbi:hypothetical protein [Xanthovirga aplysinae]|uniref:hypothetical protein n=1 Tax=Xanthovirga aplysinae TaxID=2529853 RepID=UPI0012BCB184|nr:hypothetical protein [Xanthovirga aplysinae]MTI29883.1 hypothetical protein [Xanthovirga aplysinae]
MHKIKAKEESLNQILQSFNQLKDQTSISIQGIEINPLELHKLLEPYFFMFEDELLELLEKIDTHPRKDKIWANGIYFTVGGTKIGGLLNRLSLKSKLNYRVSSNPLLDNIKDIGKVIASPEKFRNHLIA